MPKLIPKTILVLAGLLLLSPLGPSRAILSCAEVDLSDDAYHYGLFRDGKHDANYIEWWYFNLIDEASGIQAIFHYSIFNPDNILNFGKTNVGANIFTPQGIFHESDSFPTDSFWASDSEPHVKIGNADFQIGNEDVNFIEVIEHNTFHIVGSIGNGRISWDLYYEPQIAPWYAADRQHVGRRPWEHMSWLVYAPGAYVTGEVVLDGEKYHVQQASGYHDHNWGEWIPFNALWNWVQYFEPGLALEVGDFRYSPVGVVGIEFAGVKTVFEKDEYSLFHTKWTSDPENRKWFPRVSWLLAENEDKRLIVRIQTLATETLGLPIELPPILPEMILYEQTAFYSGQLWHKNQKGTWDSAVKFQGSGFKEYSVLKFTD